MYVFLTVYFALAFLYFVQQRFTLVRKNEVFVFSSNIPNLCIADPACIYRFCNVQIKKKYSTTNIPLQLFSSVECVIDNEAALLQLRIDAVVNLLGLSKHSLDPVEMSIKEIQGAVANIIHKCDTFQTYVLLSTQDWSEFSKHLLYTNVCTMSIAICGVQKTTPDSTNDPAL